MCFKYINRTEILSCTQNDGNDNGLEVILSAVKDLLAKLAYGKQSPTEEANVLPINLSEIDYGDTWHWPGLFIQIDKSLILWNTRPVLYRHRAPGADRYPGSLSSLRAFQANLPTLSPRRRPL